MKCPECGRPNDVPDPEDVYDTEDYADDSQDDYGDSYEDDRTPSRPRRRSTGTGRKKKKQSSGISPALLIGLAAGIGGLAVIGVVLALVMSSGDDEPQPQDVAQVSVDEPAAPDATTGQPADSTVPADVITTITTTGNTTSTDTPPADPAMTEVISTTNADTGNPTPANPAPPVSATNPDGRFWVVLSNLTVKDNTFSNAVSVDYRVVQGKADPSKRYILYFGKPSAGGRVERYLEYDEFTLAESGSIKFDIGGAMTFGSEPRVFMGYVVGEQKWEKVSGEAGIRETTSATPPPTLKEVAGVEAQGKLFALAFAKANRDFGPSFLSVDFLLQAPINGSATYVLVLEHATAGRLWEADISRKAQITRVDQKDTLAADLFRAGLHRHRKGKLTVYVEERESDAAEEGTLVSNRATVGKL